MKTLFNNQRPKFLLLLAIAYMLKPKNKKLNNYKY